MSLTALHESVNQCREESGCAEWSAILKAYQNAVNAHSKAVLALGPPHPLDFAGAWLRAEITRKDSETLRAELLDHEHHHGCFVNSPAACEAEPAIRSVRRR
jgi:hypothetical protein